MPRFRNLRVKPGIPAPPPPPPPPDPGIPPADTTGWLFLASNLATVPVSSPYVMTVKWGTNVHVVQLDGVTVTGAVASGSGTTLFYTATVSKTRNTAGTYTETLTAININGVPYTPVTASVVVTGTGTPAPTISGFAVTPNNAVAGDTVSLNAVVANATALAVNGTAVASLPTTLVVSSNNQIFTLVATGAGGSTSASVGLINGNSDTDFNLRRFGPGVLRSEDFESIASLGPNYTSVNNYILDNPGVYYGNDGVKLPSIDTAQKASGSSSLNIKTYPSPGAPWPASGGTWFMDFSPDPDLAVQLGANSKFYVQVRVRWDSTMLDTLWQVTDGSLLNGIKIFDIVASDVVGGPRPSAFNGQTHYDTSSEIKVVVVSRQHHNIDTYKFDGNNLTFNLDEPFGSGDYMEQNALGTGACTYSGVIAAGGGNAPVAGCVNMTANEWVTFEIEITLGAEGTWPDLSAYPIVRPDWPVWLNSSVRLWVARESAPTPVKILDWNPTVAGYQPLWRGPVSDNQKYGKVNLFPYMTDKSPTQAHPIGNAWYDELIISTQPIKFPGQYDLPGLPISTGTSPGLAGLTAGGTVALPNFFCTNNYPANSCGEVTDFSGMRYDANRGRAVMGPGGGHSATNYDAISCLTISTLTWAEEFAPTPTAAMIPACWDGALTAWTALARNYGATGPYPRPTSRHTYCLNVLVGDALITLIGVDGDGGFPVSSGWPQTGNYNTNGIGKIVHYNLVTKAFTYTNTNCPLGYPGAAYDPTSAKIILAGNTGLWTYDMVSTVLTQWIDSGQYVGAAQYKDENGNPIDPNIIGSAVGYANPLTHSPINDRFYIFNRGNGSIWEVTLNRSNFALSTFQRIATTGSWPGGGQIAEMNANYDTANNLIVAGPFNGVMYALNPLTRVITTQNPAAFAGYYVAYDAHCYDPVNNAHILLTYAAAGDYNGSTTGGGTARKGWAFRWA